MRKPYKYTFLSAKEKKKTLSWVFWEGRGAYGLEGGDGAWLGRDVVDQDAASDLGAEVVVKLVGGAELLHALEGAVAGLEVQVRGPVVAVCL